MKVTLLYPTGAQAGASPTGTCARHSLLVGRSDVRVEHGQVSTAEEAEAVQMHWIQQRYGVEVQPRCHEYRNPAERISGSGAARPLNHGPLSGRIQKPMESRRDIPPHRFAQPGPAAPARREAATRVAARIVNPPEDAVIHATRVGASGMNRPGAS